MVSPEVLVLVMSGMGRGDQVAINYTTSLSRDALDKDLVALRDSSGWMITGAAAKTGRSATGKPTTSITFNAQTVVDARQGLLPLSPFITALKRYKSIQLMFMTPGEFQFRGLKDFENRYVKIKLESDAAPFRFAVAVKNSRFERLQLPLRQPAASPKQSHAMPLGARVLLIVALATLCSVAAYVIAARFWGSGKQAH